MLILAINTCGAEGLVALADEDALLGQERLPGRGSSEQMLPGLRRLFAETGRRAAELTAVAVVHGPGSFTGVRVGLSTAKGLCEAAGCEILAISRLELVAAAVGDGGAVLALLDAGRAEFFCGAYVGGRLESEALVSSAEVRKRLLERRGVTCEVSVAEAFNGGVVLVREPGAEEILAVARRRIVAGEWSDVALVDANYLRRTDAELAVQTSAGQG